MIAVGITTYNRPEFAEKCAKAAFKHLDGLVDRWYIHDDGSDSKHAGAYKRAFKAIPNVRLLRTDPNAGVAFAKNRLLEAMLRDGADWCFLLEDDIRVLSPEAVTGYLAAAEASGSHHLSFAHHGPANVLGPVGVAGPIAFYPHAIGAWCLYSRECLEKVGLFDEALVNAWEHVEHTLRLMDAGFCPGAGPFRFPDAAGSRDWLAEIPGAIEKSFIRPRTDWQRNIREGLGHWRTTRPETFAQMFGPGAPLEGYAQSLIGPT